MLLYIIKNREIERKPPFYNIYNVVFRSKWLAFVILIICPRHFTLLQPLHMSILGLYEDPYVHFSPIISIPTNKGSSSYCSLIVLFLTLSLSVILTLLLKTIISNNDSMSWFCEVGHIHCRNLNTARIPNVIYV